MDKINFKGVLFMTKMLTTVNSKGKETLVIDSREVAEMLGKKHEDIMKAIKGSGKNLGIIKK